MEPIHLCLALGPLALYFFMLGLVNLSRRPLLVTGARDSTALGLALAGFVVVGPMQLFMPEQAATQFGPYVWLLMVAFYALCVSLWILLARPRLVIYNISPLELRPILAELAPTLDSDARLVGDSLLLPQLGVQLHLDYFKLLRNSSLIATGDLQSFSGWRRFELALRGRLCQAEVTASGSHGLAFINLGLLMLGVIVYRTIENPQAVAQGLRSMLRM